MWADAAADRGLCVKVSKARLPAVPSDVSRIAGCAGVDIESDPRGQLPAIAIEFRARFGVKLLNGSLQCGR